MKKRIKVLSKKKVKELINAFTNEDDKKISQIIGKDTVFKINH